MLKWRTRRRWCARTTRTKSTRRRAVGTAKKSIETRSRTWLARNVCHVCEGGGRRCEISRDTVRSATSIPSFRSSPWIRGAPQRIGGGHFADERDDLGVDRRAAPGGPPGELGPVLAKAAPLPTEHGVGSNDDEGPPPACPPPGHPDPEPSIAPAESRPRRCPLVHGKLLAQGQV